MARNSSGTHSLPSGNPVVSGASISSTTNNNTMSDISSEITDSLSRSGKGAMLAPLELANGTVALPALSFDSDTDCGLYRIGANNVGVAVNGAKVLDVGTAGLGVTGTLVVSGNTTIPTVAGATTFAAGVTVNQSTSNTDAIAASGNGTGDGIQATSSGAGAGGRFSSTSGNAIDVGTGNAKFSGSSPASTTGFSNTLTPANIAKAHGQVVGGSLGAQTVSGGFNVASATLVDAGVDGIVIAFATAMADANYTVLVNSDTVGLRAYVTERAAGSFKIALAAFVSPWTVQAYTQFSSSIFDFVVLGAQ